MSDKSSAPVRPQKPVESQKSNIALVMAAALTMFTAIKGTKPRVKGFDGEGRMRFRIGTHRIGGRGKHKSMGGTPEVNRAVYNVPLKFLHRHRREIERAKASAGNAAFERGPL